ncbi:MAG TPA: nitrous oxide reductase accessory protein NosL [Rhodobacteraceae bacterium]|nr:nitrous oxide reductase accessory protein NosL [Paracoccaceae bacterium]
MSAQADTTKTVAPIIDLPKPGPTDACPVCGMFPAKYPDWVATVLFEDGHADHFDGAKDFFKYLLDMDKFASGRKKEQITGLGVTDYYATELIDAKQAIYVIGSDVLGPMGHDLIPHPDRYDADAFMKDHKGYKLLRFDQITKSMLFGLDDGKFDQ